MTRETKVSAKRGKLLVIKYYNEEERGVPVNSQIVSGLLSRLSKSYWRVCDAYIHEGKENQSREAQGIMTGIDRDMRDIEEYQVELREAEKRAEAAAAKQA